MNTVDIAVLHECFEYNFEDGTLFWKERPVNHFLSEKDCDIWNSKFARKKAGCLDKYGYLQLRLRIKGTETELRGHRVIWAMNTGYWPINQIDHKNGNRSDNRLENMREATHADNMKNQKNVQGACWHIRDKKWVTWAGRYYTCDTKEEAQKVWLDYRIKTNVFQPIPRDWTGPIP
jgi:hypothetical protein